WRTGVSPIVNATTVSTGLSFNIGSKTDMLETGLGVGYLFYLRNNNNEDYVYFAPSIGYRRMSPSGFLFKAYLTMLTVKEDYYYGNYGTYGRRYVAYPFLGFSFGYSF